MAALRARALFVCIIAVITATAFPVGGDVLVTRTVLADDSRRALENGQEQSIYNQHDRNADLLTWATQRAPCTDCFLVVGVKTRAVRGFERRQIIRAAWAHPSVTQSLRVRVVFLGCNPDLSQEAAPNATLVALEHEKQTFGDLLTHELGGCVDGYERLVDKTLGFLHWASVQHPSAPFVMVADDDVYVRLDRVVAILQDPSTPRTRYYAGQVPYVQRGELTLSIRNPSHRNYIPFDVYPLAEHVPRAIGAHFLLSIDLVQFLSRNRRTIRGVGAIEDLSVGFWLRYLLGVRPVHIPVFGVAFYTICHNAFASYGELSLGAMRQIQHNFERGHAFCHGFSWSRWITANARDWPYPTFPPRTDVAYEWNFRAEVATRTMRIVITVHLSDVPLTFDLSFTPSHAKYQALCAQLDAKSAELGRRLPLMLCYDLLDRLGDFICDHPPFGTAHLALTQSNLPPLTGILPVTVSLWVSRRVLRWRAFLESLMAVVYPDIHVFVLDEVTAPDPTAHFSPDFVAVDALELLTLPPLPPHCHRLVFAPTPSSADEDQTILFAHDWRPRSDDLPHMYVPVASLVFSDSLVHSPLALLESNSRRRPNITAPGGVAVPYCNTRVTEMLAFLPDMSRQTPYFRDLEPVDGTAFAFDADVEAYSRAKFVLAFESDQGRPGYIAETIVAAFVAGSIPIYDGDESTVLWLFNPKSFIHCGRFKSLEACAVFAMEVHQSPTTYDAMREEKPVVNTTAFYDVFSWHPDVRRAMRRLEGRPDMAERLGDLITSV